MYCIQQQSIVYNFNRYCIVLVFYCIIPIFGNIVLVLYSWQKCCVAQAWIERAKEQECKSERARARKGERDSESETARAREQESESKIARARERARAREQESERERARERERGPESESVIAKSMSFLIMSFHAIPAAITSQSCPFCHYCHFIWSPDDRDIILFMH